MDNNKNNKSTLLKEAIDDYNAIKTAAENVAKKRLASEYPNKFNDLLKEELDKNKKKESYIKIDEQESDSDEITANTKTEMNKKKDETVNTVDKKDEKKKESSDKSKIKEDVKVTDTVGDSKPYNEKTKGENIVSEEREKDFMGDIESETPNTAKNSAEDGNRFTEKIKNPTSGKPISNIKEDFNITELDVNNVESAIDNSDENDEFTIDDIENELSSLENTDTEYNMSDVTASNDNDPIEMLNDLKNQLDLVLKNLSGESSGENINNVDIHEDSISTDDTISNLDINEIDISDDEIDLALSNNEFDDMSMSDDIDETLGMSYPNKRATTATLPNKDYQSDGNIERMRYSMRESEKKINGLINENKKLTKRLNESKKLKNELTKLTESYKTALEKYRNQLKEMATFNTNLAHVNNLLINENLTLSHTDKIDIINEFKKINTITESQNKYNDTLAKYKDNRTTISENIERNVSASIQPSSKNILNEVIEKTAYVNNDHINRIKKLIQYTENRSTK